MNILAVSYTVHMYIPQQHMLVQYVMHINVDISMYIAQPEQIDAAKDVIKKLTFPFDSESFENPGMYTNGGMLTL